MTGSTPQPIKPGIAIVALGGYGPDEAALPRAIARLQERACVVKNYYLPAEKFQRFGGTDSARLAQLHAAVRDPDVQVVLMLRGGYGLSRLSPELDFEML